MKKMIFGKTLYIILLTFVFSLSATVCRSSGKHFTNPAYDLRFRQLASSRDEAIPLGNGMLGALIWQKGEHLRFSPDRADLWDLRPMGNLKTPQWKFKWVYRQWKNNTYRLVQDAFDVPYDNNPAPSKNPAVAIEFNTQSLGKTTDVHLALAEAFCSVKWTSRAELQTWVHASKQAGWFKFDHL